MVLRMVKLGRDPKTGSWTSRKVIPADVRAAYGKQNQTPAWPAKPPPAEGKAAWSAWLSEVEMRIDRLRKAAIRSIRLVSSRSATLAGLCPSFENRKN